LAVTVSAALFLLGHVPRGHPLVPALQFRFPLGEHEAGAVSFVPTRLRGPSVARVGSTFTVRGDAPGDLHDPVFLRGKWGSSAWETLARAHAVDGTYLLRIRLDRPGSLRLKVRAANRTLAVGAIRVK
jgi:hypothetical protein